MGQTSRQSKVVLVMVMSVGALIGLLRFNSFQAGAFSDDAHYVVLAESLASGRGLHLINFPDAPAEKAFPPGWPVLLSPLTALFPGNYTVLKLVSFVLWLASIPLMYKLFARRIGSPYLEITVAMIALNPSMIGISGMVMSEAAYLFCSLLTLFLFELWSDRRDRSGYVWLLVMVSVIAFYAQLIRTVGISMMLTIVVFLLLLRRFRELVTVVAIFLIGMALQLRLNAQNGGSLVSSGYQSQVFSSSLAAKLMQVWTNLQSYLDGMITNSLIPIFGPKATSALDKLGIELVPSLVSFLVLSFIVFGFALSLKRFRISDLYVSFYFLAILAFWNPSVGSAQARFLIPIIPFLCFYFVQANAWLIGRFVVRDSRRTLWIVAGSASLILLVLLARNIQDLRNPVRNRITDLSIGTSWVYENTPPEAVIMARDPLPDYLYTRRTTVEYPSDKQSIEEYIRVNRVDYIIVSPKLQTPRSNKLDDYTEFSLLPVLKLNPDKFAVEYKNTDNNVTVYRVDE